VRANIANLVARPGKELNISAVPEIFIDNHGYQLGIACVWQIMVRSLFDAEMTSPLDTTSDDSVGRHNRSSLVKNV
jgi:hypothetical protein